MSTSAPSTLPASAGTFVAPGSIVRGIWGDADVILLVFAGSAAEFALNRAVDWLFFTGAIPRDPIGRFFSTAEYARHIVFASNEEAAAALARIRSIHDGVQRARAERIPAWAFRDVLYMLVDYSQRGFELLHRRLTADECEELYDVFRRVGEALDVQALPPTYVAWREDRARHLARDLVTGPYTADLQAAYRRELGALRYGLLRQVQSVLVPAAVLAWTGQRPSTAVRVALGAYRVLARGWMRRAAHRVLIPAAHVERVRRLDCRGDGEAGGGRREA